MGSSGAARGLIAPLVLVLLAGAAGAECRPETLDLRGPFGTASFSVELADTPDERATGLMHRDSMASAAGMLFVYEQPQRASFWMKNTLIPLDMVFADSSGRVTRVHANAVPHDETPIDGGKDVALVLEINGGLAARLGLAEGAQMRHPSIAQAGAVWPCDSE